MRALNDLCMVLEMVRTRSSDIVQEDRALEIMDMVWRGSDRIWDALWEIRTPFLGSQPILLQGDGASPEGVKPWWRILVRSFAEYMVGHERRRL